MIPPEKLLQIYHNTQGDSRIKVTSGNRNRLKVKGGRQKERHYSLHLISFSHQPIHLTYLPDFLQPSPFSLFT
jgi:hypothetical protein